ncbi:MAG: glycosyltransferase [Phycisphaerales bacterium]
MRACLVSTEFAPFSGWGVGSYAANMARALIDAGHETHVLTAPAPGVHDRGAEFFPGVRFHTIDRSGAPASLPHVPCRATQGPLAIFQTLRSLDEACGFDYVEFADCYGLAYFAVQARRTLGLFPRAALAVRLHSPIVLLRRINGQSALDLNTACVEHMEAEAIRGADLVIAPSRAIVEEVRRLLGPDGEEAPTNPPARTPEPWIARTRVLPYPFPAMAPAERAVAGAPAATPEVLFAGRLEHRKGVHLLVDSAQQLLVSGVDLRVRIIGVDTNTAPGGGSVAASLRSRIEPRWAGAFAFEPNQPRDGVLAAMRSADVVCVPSLWENFPNVVLEAMSLGRCVVGADTGGIPEIIRDGRDGLLFRGGDAGSLAEVLRRATGDPGLRRRVGAGAPARVAALCEPRKVVALLESMLAEIGPRGRDVPEPPSLGGVTVVIPFFNLARFLTETLRSIADQSVPPDEVVLVDDGSTDADAGTLVDRLGREGRIDAVPIRVIRQPNRGLSAARNTGLRGARTRWVVPLDADDLLAPTFIEKVLAAAAREPDAILVTSWMSCFEDSPQRPTMLFVPVGFERDMLCVANVASSCTALLDREAVLAAGGYDESLAAFEDWDLYATLAERADAVGGERGDPRILIIPEPLILNRIRPDSMLRVMSAGTRHGLTARILQKHPRLARHPDRALRMLLARTGPAAAPIGQPSARPAVPRAQPAPSLLRRVMGRRSP